MTIVITGTSNGLGKHLTNLLSKEEVITINRTPTRSRNEIVCDLSVPKDVEKAKKQLLPLLNSKEVLFILNAAIYGDDEDLEDVNPQKISEVIYTNVISQLSIVEKLLKSGTKVRLIAISSQMGSIKFAPEPYHFVYSISKAGLNLSIRLLKKNFKNLDYFIVDPGWMRTRMGGDDATDDPADVARRIIDESKININWNREDGMLEVNKKQVVPW